MKTRNWAFFGLVAIIAIFGLVGCEDKDDGGDPKAQVNTTLFGSGAKVTGYMTDSDWAIACAKLKAGYDSIVAEGGQTATRVTTLYGNNLFTINLSNTLTQNYNFDVATEVMHYKASDVLGLSASALGTKIGNSINGLYAEQYFGNAPNPNTHKGA